MEKRLQNAIRNSQRFFEILKEAEKSNASFAWFKSTLEKRLEPTDNNSLNYFEVLVWQDKMESYKKTVCIPQEGVQFGKVRIKETVVIFQTYYTAYCFSSCATGLYIEYSTNKIGGDVYPASLEELLVLPRPVKELRNLQDKNNSLQRKNNSLQEEINSLQRKNNSLQKEIDNLIKEKEKEKETQFEDFLDFYYEGIFRGLKNGISSYSQLKKAVRRMMEQYQIKKEV